jgi:hypothetical protein
MKPIQFNAVVGADQVIRPPAGVALPQGEIEVVVRPRPNLMARSEDRLRQVCTQRGVDWDKLTEEERECLIDDLVHEDRACGR